MKVFPKIFNILEEVALASPTPVTPAWLAERLSLNRPTCARIVRELVAAGYLSHVSRQAGYVAGPRALALARVLAEGDDRVRVADEPLRRCARELRRSLIMAVLHRGRRHIILHHNASPAPAPRPDHLVHDDLYRTATGLVLLAWASPSTRREAREAGNGPDDFYSRVADGRDEERLFDDLRQDGGLAFRDPSWRNAIAAYPVFRDGDCVAAVGLYTDYAEQTTADEWSALCRRAHACAREISAALSVPRLLC